MSKANKLRFNAAAKMDWQQVVLNGGPPCFHLSGKKFCGRAQRWVGHGNGIDHQFVSLENLLKATALRASGKPAGDQK